MDRPRLSHPLVAALGRQSDRLSTRYAVGLAALVAGRRLDWQPDLSALFLLVLCRWGDAAGQARLVARLAAAGSGFAPACDQQRADVGGNGAA